MKRFAALKTAVLSVLILALAASSPGHSSIGNPPQAVYLKTSVLGVRAHVVTVDLNDPTLQVGVVLPMRGPGASEPFLSMISRTRPVAAITGTFFCTRSLLPIGDIVTDGRRVNAGAIGACLAVTPDNQVKLTPGRRGIRADWTGYDTGVRSGPLLVSGGRININARTEGFRDRRLFGRHVRASIGVTAHNKLLLVVVRTPVTFGELAKVMRALGAVEAINLDGGSSTALSYGGRILVNPGRRMTNLIVVQRRTKPALPVTTAACPLTPPLTIAISNSPTPFPPDEDSVALTVPEHHAILPEKVEQKKAM